MSLYSMVEKSNIIKKDDKKKKLTPTEKSREWQKSRRIIYILPQTKIKLNYYGLRGDTFDSVIENLIDFAESNKKQYDLFLMNRKKDGNLAISNDSIIT